MASFDFQSAQEAEQQKRLKRTLALSPEERLDRFVALQQAAMALLASNPSALEAFHRRNRQKRTESRVRDLESHLLAANTKDAAR